MYCLPSTSQIWAPCARSTKNGSPLTLRKARTGEFTPPGMRFLAAENNSCERRPIGQTFNAHRSTFNVELRNAARGLGKHRTSNKEGRTGAGMEPVGSEQHRCR